MMPCTSVTAWVEEMKKKEKTILSSSMNLSTVSSTSSCLSLSLMSSLLV